jgi:hypothetical protein
MWVRLHEEGGKRHEMACHHNLDIRTLRPMWRTLETESRKILNGHEGGKPRIRAKDDPTGYPAL